MSNRFLRQNKIKFRQNAGADSACIDVTDFRQAAMALAFSKITFEIKIVDSHRAQLWRRTHELMRRLTFGGRMPDAQ